MSAHRPRNLSEMVAIISTNLRQSRASTDLTSTDMALAMGVTREQYEAIEVGDFDAVADVVTITRLTKAAEALGTTDDALLADVTAS